MNVILTNPAQKKLKKIPLSISKKLQRQMHTLKDDPYHPSLRFRKMQNSIQFEGRIDYQYRFTGKFIGEDFYITSIGPHDSGLGKR